jgi:hypothetical protein
VISEPASSKRTFSKAFGGEATANATRRDPSDESAQASGKQQRLTPLAPALRDQGGTGRAHQPADVSQTVAPAAVPSLADIIDLIGTFAEATEDRTSLGVPKPPKCHAVMRIKNEEKTTTELQTALLVLSDCI